VPKNVGRKKKMNFAIEGITGTHVGEVSDRWLPASHNPQSNRVQAAPHTAPPFFNLFIFYFYFGSMREFGDGPGILGGWVYNFPIF
jgi:hypothetical protein